MSGDEEARLDQLIRDTEEDWTSVGWIYGMSDWDGASDEEVQRAALTLIGRALVLEGLLVAGELDEENLKGLRDA